MKLNDWTLHHVTITATPCLSIHDLQQTSWFRWVRASHSVRESNLRVVSNQIYQHDLSLKLIWLDVAGSCQSDIPCGNQFCMLKSYTYIYVTQSETTSRCKSYLHHFTHWHIFCLVKTKDQVGLGRLWAIGMSILKITDYYKVLSG